MSEPVKPEGVVNIVIDDFAKIDLRVGTVVAVKDHPDPKVDKLLILTVRVGLEDRQILAGIKKHYTAEQLLNTQIVVVANLPPRTLRGEVSHGMLLAAGDDKGNLSLIRPDKAMEPGSAVR